jgi:hypothetical protein
MLIRYIVEIAPGIYGRGLHETRVAAEAVCVQAKYVYGQIWRVLEVKLEFVDPPTKVPDNVVIFGRKK